MSIGLKANADGSGAVQVGGSDAITITSGLAVSLPTGNFAFNSGYGSAATAYGCRAWVNFNGTGAVAIRASGNVTSITDNGVGDYTVIFTNAMPDANYSWSVSAGRTTNTVNIAAMSQAAPTSSALRFQTSDATNNLTDMTYATVAIFR